MRDSNLLQTQGFWHTAATLLLSMVAFAAPATSQVILDGTTGSSGALTGPDYDITDDLGTRAGDNLFHSFSDFSLDTGEIATFSGPDQIANVISRVTGNNPSEIDGTLRSTMPDADFYFINPNGVTFGPNATLDVQGSFYVSTADELRLEGGATFSATNPDASGLAVAEPRAFGFLDATPGTISVDGSTLTIDEGEALSLVGGDITIDGNNDGTLVGGDDGLLRAEGGTINLIALGGEGETAIANSDPIGDIGGQITLTDQAHIDTSGDGGGSLRVRGARLTAEGGARLTTNNLGETDSTGGVDIRTGVLQLENTTIDSSADRESLTLGGPIVDAGDISIVAEEMIATASEIKTDTEQMINANGGEISISVDTISLIETEVSTSTGIGSTGRGGNISIKTKNMDMVGGEIESSLLSSGDAGDIIVDVSDQLIIDAGLIESFSPSPHGPVNASGLGGDVTIRASSLVLQNHGAISSTAGGIGGAGNINVDADDILLDGRESISLLRATGIFSEGGIRTAGTVGDIFIKAGTLRMRGRDAEIVSDPTRATKGVVISTSVGIASNSDGGDITIKVGSLETSRGLIASDAKQSGGAAGGITINANQIELDQSSIRTESDVNRGGRISITAQDYVRSVDSEIVSSGAEPLAGASVIKIQSGALIFENSRVFSLTGDGVPITGSGTIDISGDFIFMPAGNLVDASSSVEIAGPLNDSSSQLVVLDSQFVDVSRLLRPSCEHGGDLGGSTFFELGRSPPIVPNDGLVPGFYSDAFVSVQEQKVTGASVTPTLPCLDLIFDALESKSNEEKS